MLSFTPRDLDQPIIKFDKASKLRSLSFELHGEYPQPLQKLFLEILQYSPNLKELKVGGTWLNGTLALTQMNLLPISNLKKVSYVETKYPISVGGKFERQLETNIEFLKLFEVEVEKEELLQLLKFVAPNLKSLELQGCESFDAEAFQMIIHSMNKLKALQVSGNSKCSQDSFFTQSAFKNSSEMLNKFENTRLKELDLGTCVHGLYILQLESISRLTLWFPNLTKLSLTLGVGPLFKNEEMETPTCHVTLENAIVILSGLLKLEDLCVTISERIEPAKLNDTLVRLGGFKSKSFNSRVFLKILIVSHL